MVMSFVLTAAFLIDFLYRLRIAPSKKHYMIHGFGWADMLASLPFAQTNWLRLFRLIKVYRLLKDYGIRNIGRSLVKERAESALLMLLFVGILVLEFGSLALLKLEATDPGANITDASDALWYVIVTMSTVGYGDEYPITNPGRVVGSIIIIVGVGIFGTLTGYLANLFLTPSRKAAQKITDVQTHLQELKELAERQQATISELSTLLEGRRD